MDYSVESRLEELYRSHPGETAVIIGNGPSLNDIPDEFLNAYPSFGCNRIWERKDFSPTYYVAVDTWVPRENEEFYSVSCPIVVPFPNMDRYPADYRFRHRPGPLWMMEKDLHRDYMFDPGIAYVGAPHAMLQLGFFMGFRRFLCVGLDNTGGPAHHFYQGEGDMNRQVDPELWDWGFSVLRDCFLPATILNLSTVTAVTSLPRVDWRNCLT